MSDRPDGAAPSSAEFGGGAGPAGGRSGAGEPGGAGAAGALRWHPAAALPGDGPPESRTLPWDDRGRAVEPLTAVFAGLRLVVPAASRVGAGADGGWEIAPEEGGPITFAGVAVPSALRVDAEAGVISFAVAVPAPLLQTSVRWFWATAGGAAPPLAGVDCPIFPGAGTVPLAVALDLVDPARSELALAVQEPLPSGFATPSGGAVRLVPVLPGARVVPQWDPVAGTSYLAPDGPFVLRAPTGASGPEVDVVLGLSGLETARVPDGATVSFHAGSPAFAAGFGPTGATGPVTLATDAPGSPYPVTTAWLSFPQGASSGYYSQPRVAGIFEQAAGDPLLHQLALRAADLPAGPTGFPAAPYAGATAAGPVGSGWPQTVALLEQQVLTPGRAGALPPQATAAGATGEIEAVTPQGLRSVLSSDLRDWKRLVLAASPQEEVALGPVDGALRTALLASELFLVVSDPEALAGRALPAGWHVTDQVLAAATARGVPDDVVAAAGRLVGAPLLPQPAFAARLRAAIGDAAFAQWGALLIELSAAVVLTIDQWSFELTPAAWSTDPNRPTLLIVKSSDADITTLAGDWRLWTEARAFNRYPAATQAVLAKIVADARAGGDHFADTVVKEWNGVLWLNCPVPAGSFPPELRGLTAGMTGTLLAHHLGSDGSPIDVGSTIATGPSSLFGVIDYQDPGDLSFTGDPYAFKVLSLHVTFANSHITGFTSQVELLVGALFGEHSAGVGGAHGDNLLFVGTWQRRDGASSYAFRTAERSLYTVDSGVVASFTVNQGEFATVLGATSGDTVVSQFKLTGVVRFFEQTGFDLFSFGTTSQQSAIDLDAPGLAVAGLIVRMTERGGGARRTVEFAFDVRESTLDLAASTARPGSLYSKFPLAAIGLVQGEPGAKPASLGFLPVATPLTAGSLARGWFGLSLTLDLGAAGGLAAATDLTAGLLASWSPTGNGTTDLQAGLRLPGSQAGGSGISLMGPLRIDIGAIRFLADAAGSGYLLRFETIALAFLGVRFPSGGRTNLLLFGDPDPEASGGRLGWYGAYRKDRRADDGSRRAGQPALPTASGGR